MASLAMRLGGRAICLAHHAAWGRGGQCSDSVFLDFATFRTRLDITFYDAYGNCILWMMCLYRGGIIQPAMCAAEFFVFFECIVPMQP